MQGVNLTGAARRFEYLSYIGQRSQDAVTTLCEPSHNLSNVVC